MAKKELRIRTNWQTKSGPCGLAGTAEKNLIAAFKEEFKGTHYEINNHPNDLKHLYENVELDESTLSQIYCPDFKTMKNAQKRGWGISPDFSIINTVTKKYYLEKLNVRMVG